MKRLVVGILAHVDAGKTTLSEALLYRGGCLRKLGRVDHQDAFLDTDVQERERGITIFSKQARLPLGDVEFQLLDTPGHVDFSAEMERTLQVLDYAILVISGTDGVQSHTRTLWNLLERYQVPAFLFINKMDLSSPGPEVLLRELQSKLSGGCVDFGDAENLEENAAVCDEAALNEYLENGTLPEEWMAELIAKRKLFPCRFGSALKLEGVDELLESMVRLCRAPQYPSEFAARVYKIARDGQGNRLTYLKITGGTLKVRSALRSGTESNAWEEKVNQIRLYSGTKFQPADEAESGTVCAVTGLSHTMPGDGLGAEEHSAAPVLEPVLNYQLFLPEGCDPHLAMGKLSQLAEEDPLLRIVWNEQLRSIHVQLMGEIQMEVLQRLIRDRFGWEVQFGQGQILYRETIASAVEGIGHFEPLRHYAEVHLLLEPGERGSGIEIASACPTDQLAGHWQNLIRTHLEEREHPGVLTGSPITDLHITILSGRAHDKHTEGGDFRQATYRAVRQGLMQAESILLEPWYEFRLEVPSAQVGRAMTDLQCMNGEVDPPETAGEETILTGSAPVSRLQGYAAEVAAYTRGLGRLSCTLKGYAPCTEQAAVVEAIGYEAERDLANPSGSVFCSHGAGITIPWNEVAQHAHLPTLQQRREAPAQENTVSPARRNVSGGSFEEDKELQAIFERTYGPVKRRDLRSQAEVRRQESGASGSEHREIRTQKSGPEYLLVDGYNMIFAWDELKTVARDNLDAARKILMDILSNYQGFRKCEVILVFDAYKVPHGTGEVSRYHNIHVVYTKESQTADAYIEKATYEIGREHRVRVATSDGAEQLIILGHGALRVPASALREEIEAAEGQISAILRSNNRPGGVRTVRDAMEKARDGQK